ncbi:ABC transporter ATP-binding protein/permease [Streptococcus pneumoniae]|nr:ABC transporter ATP-binding protein/permease [Streptococcus pneumoniae]
MLIQKIKTYKWQALASLLMTGLMVASSLLQPRYLQEVLGALLTGKYEAIYSIGAWLIGVAVVGLVAGGLNVVLSAYIAQGVSSDLREDAFRKIQTFSYADIEQFNAGNLVVRMTNDINQIQNVVMMTFQILFRLPLLFIGSFILAVQTLPSLWWVIVLMVVLIFGLTAVMMGMMGPRFAKFQTLLERINAIAKENLRGVRVVKSFVQEKEQFAKFTEVSDELLGQNLYIGYAFSVVEPFMMLVGYGAVFLSIWLVAGMVQSDPSVVGSIASFVNYLSQIIFTIVMVGFLGNSVSRAMISMRRIRKILDAEPAMTFKDIPDEELVGSLSFENVTFTYPMDKEPMLKDVSFTIEPGQMVGVVGATGAGKSTLAQLIPRLFDPQEGAIKIGGKDIREVSEGTLRKTVSIVLQRAILFSGTIADNLRQGKGNATLFEMERAANIAQASEFIHRMEKTFESPVEERGTNFSGGQKQRMSIARGIVSNPRILIFDDSTSALDAKSERLVQEALNKDLKGTTTIIIAQKISSVVHADKILVLNQGRLIGQGTHADLVANNAVYREIYEIGGYYAYSKELIDGVSVCDFDVTKLSVYTQGIGLTGIEVYDLLRDEYDIQIEFGDIGNILAYISIGDRIQDIERLVGALADIKRLYSRDGKDLIAGEYIQPELVLSPQEAFYSERKSLTLDDSVGQVCGEFVMCYPPGIPILAPGERITREIVDYIQFAKERGCSLQGTEDPEVNHINVIKRKTNYKKSQ